MEALLLSFWGSFSLLLAWLIRIGALIVVPFRRSVASARVWLLLFFLVPFLTLLLFLVLGRPRHSRSRRQLFSRLPEMLSRVAQ